MINFEQDRYMITSKDKSKILSHKGFKNISNHDYNLANPMLFSTVGGAKEYINNKYNYLIDDLIFVKVKVVYAEYE